jgi:hypothetical protein
MSSEPIKTDISSVLKKFEDFGKLVNNLIAELKSRNEKLIEIQEEVKKCKEEKKKVHSDLSNDTASIDDLLSQLTKGIEDVSLGDAPKEEATSTKVDPSATGSSIIGSAMPTMPSFISNPFSGFSSNQTDTSKEKSTEKDVTSKKPTEPEEDVTSKKTTEPEKDVTSKKTTEPEKDVTSKENPFSQIALDKENGTNTEKTITGGGKKKQRKNKKTKRKKLGKKTKKGNTRKVE